MPTSTPSTATTTPDGCAVDVLSDKATDLMIDEWMLDSRKARSTNDDETQQGNRLET
jgi:hypothetical protein